MTSNDEKIIAELVVHIDYIRNEMASIKNKLDSSATKEDLENMKAELKKQIEDNKIDFWTITKVSAGALSVIALIGVIIKAFAQ